MDFFDELNLLQTQTNDLYRGKIKPEVEKKIRNNIFEITQRLFSNVEPKKFFETTKLMYRDWSLEYSEDIRFGREDEANKAMIKLSTFEWILSLPSAQKMRAGLDGELHQ